MIALFYFIKIQSRRKGEQHDMSDVYHCWEGQKTVRVIIRCYGSQWKAYPKWQLGKWLFLHFFVHQKISRPLSVNDWTHHFHNSNNNLKIQLHKQTNCLCLGTTTTAAIHPSEIFHVELCRWTSLPDWLNPHRVHNVLANVISLQLRKGNIYI